MSDLDRLLKLSGQRAQSQTQETTENREMKEAVGEFAEPIYDLIDMHFEGDCQPVFDDLVRYLSGDQIKDFVADFRRHHDLPSMDEVDADTEESVEPTEPSTEEGNKFSGELAKAKEDGKDEFEVDGEKYKVKKEEFSGESVEESTYNETKMVCKDCGDELHNPTTDCPHDSHDENGDHWIEVDIDGDGDTDIKVARDMKDDMDESKTAQDGSGPWYKEQRAKEAYEKANPGKRWADLPYGYKEDWRKKTESVEENEDWVKEANRIKQLAGIQTIEEAPADDCGCDCGKSPCEACGEDHHNKEESIEEAPVQEADKTIPVNKLVPLAMDSIWDEDKENPKQVMVKSITVENPYEPGGFLDDDEDDGYRQVNVEDDGPWHIYTDSGFEKAISGMVGFNVDFTEQGMQQDGMASMEGNMEVDVKSEAFAGYKPNRFKDMPKGMNEEDKVEKEEETIEEAPTMDTTQLITLLKNAGLTEEQIKQRVDEWANTPAVGASEDKETSHGEPYENFAQSVNLSLKRYLDAEDFKVQGLKEHKVEDIKEAYKKSKESKKKEDKKD